MVAAGISRASPVQPRCNITDSKRACFAESCRHNLSNPFPRCKHIHTQRHFGHVLFVGPYTDIHEYPGQNHSSGQQSMDYGLGKHSRRVCMMLAGLLSRIARLVAGAVRYEAPLFIDSLRWGPRGSKNTSQACPRHFARPPGETVRLEQLSFPEAYRSSATARIFPLATFYITSDVDYMRKADC